MIKVTKIQPEAGSRLNLQFSDGTAGIYDCATLLAEPGPMIAPLKDRAYFDQVFLESGAPTWPNGFDLAPWALHRELADSKSLRPVNASAAE